MADEIDEYIAAGFEARRQGHSEEAKDCFARAAVLATAGNDRPRRARATAGLAQIQRDLGQYEAAIHLYDVATALYRREHDHLGIAYCLRHMGDIYRERASVRHAIECYEEALMLYRTHAGVALDIANTLRGLAFARVRTKKLEAAKDLFMEAEALYESVSVGAGVDECRAQLALLR